MLIQLCDKTMILTPFYSAYCTSVRHTKKKSGKTMNLAGQISAISQI